MNTNNRFLQITKFLIFSISLLMVAVGKEVRAQSPVSFQAKVGIGLASFWGKNTDGKAKFSYKIFKQQKVSICEYTREKTSILKAIKFKA